MKLSDILSNVTKVVLNKLSYSCLTIYSALRGACRHWKARGVQTMKSEREGSKGNHMPGF